MRLTSLIRNAVLLIAMTGMPVVGQQSIGYLRTKVDPGRAGVFIDGKYVGPAGNFGVSRKYAVALPDSRACGSIRSLEPNCFSLPLTVPASDGLPASFSDRRLITGRCPDTFDRSD